MTYDKKTVTEKLNLLAESFKGVLYEEDETFLKNMQKNNLAGDDISKYRFWEWTQGVGLYGFWKMYKLTGKKEYLDILTDYYDRQMAIGFPAKNVNTVTPLLAMCLVGDHLKRKDYLDVCAQWAEWIVDKFPRTKEGGFQHMTSDTLNEGELWDDTLFMTVLFLAQFGVITKNEKYIEEATYQFLVHIKYLSDHESGLWYHGWTFNGNHNFAKGLWGRGNSWVTIAIPEFISIVQLGGADKRFMSEAYKRQLEALKKYQDESGMWHTLVDDSSSYLEASATAGFAYGILKGVHMGICDSSYEEVAMKALKPMLECVNDKGVVEKVSYGTPMGRDNKQFYKDIPLKSMPYGTALTMLFLMEVGA